MKQIKIYFLLIIALAALTACALDDDIPGPILTDPAPAETAVLPTRPGSQNSAPDAAAEDDTLPPREGMERSRLTNEWVDAETAAARPIAVMIPNESGALPHYNLSRASVLYEANVEDRITRMMAVYEDWKGLDKIGNIRSLRAYYAYWAFEWDAFIVHLGGPFFVNELLAEPNTENIDGILGSDSGAFFRSSDRSAPHNAYATGSGLSRVISQKGYSTDYRGLSDEEHFQFTGKLTPNLLTQYGEDAKSAVYIDMSGCYPLTRCYFEYNEEDGLYYRSQRLSGSTDGPHIDAATGEQLSFKNILVQYTKSENLGEGYLAFQCHDTTRSGWYFTNGRGIPVRWEKNSDYGATRYYDANGEEITLNTGKTMICIVKEDDNFTFR